MSFSLTSSISTSGVFLPEKKKKLIVSLQTTTTFLIVSHTITSSSSRQCHGTTNHNIAYGINMIEIADTVAQFLRGAGPAVTSAATLAPEVQPLGLGAVPADKPPAELLPNELLSNIFEFLDSPKPSSSESVLHDEPHFDLTKSVNAPLKAASCVSKRWRRGTIPLLFKHAQFVVEEKKTPWSTLDEMIQPFFEFVLEHQLRRTVQSFTFVVHEEKLANIVNGQEIAYSFSFFWGRLFKAIDPKELLIVAPAVALGPLTSCRIYLVDAWSFDCPCQYLRLQLRPSHTRTPKIPQVKQNSPKSVNESTQASEPAASLSALAGEEAGEIPRAKLWEIRPWTNLLLNEGSFIRAYATYEFWNRTPPSVSECSRMTKLVRLTPSDFARSCGGR